MTELRAYHGDPAIKAKYLARVRAHREADRLIQGTGWEGGKGCAVGCTLEAYDHNLYEDELGIPATLAYLEDRIFEGLDVATSQHWPERFLLAIEPGADLSRVTGRFLLWLLSGKNSPIAKWRDSETIRAVAKLYRRRLTDDEPTMMEWVNAATAAERAGVKVGVIGAVEPRAARAHLAAWSSARYGWGAKAAPGNAARIASNGAASAWITMSNKLEELIKAAPVKEDAL